MKNRIVLLNTSILTTYGEFVYTPLTLDDVIHNINSFKEQGLEILSAIGHESTAQVLSDLLGIKVEVNRVYYTQEVTDNCIIFKLNGRPREGVILTREDIENIGYSFGLLIKKNTECKCCCHFGRTHVGEYDINHQSECKHCEEKKA